jgi:hypothetical protein
LSRLAEANRFPSRLLDPHDGQTTSELIANDLNWVLAVRTVDVHGMPLEV